MCCLPLPRTSTIKGKLGNLRLHCMFDPLFTNAGDQPTWPTLKMGHFIGIAIQWPWPSVFGCIIYRYIAEQINTQVHCTYMMEKSIILHWNANFIYWPSLLCGYCWKKPSWHAACSLKHMLSICKERFHKFHSLTNICLLSSMKIRSNL